MKKTNKQIQREFAEKAVESLSPFWRQYLTGSLAMPPKGKALEAVKKHLGIEDNDSGDNSPSSK